MTKVCIAVLHQGWIRIELATQLRALALDQRYDTEITEWGYHNTASNRNHICKHALETGADYVFMTDDDMILNGNPLDLVQYDFDVIGMPALCYKAEQGAPLRWNLRYDTLEGETIKEDFEIEGARFRKVAAVGAAGMMIARRVLEHPAMKAPFLYKLNDDGLMIGGEDFGFCDRARKAGFTIVMTRDMPEGHVKEVDLLHIQRHVAQQTS